MKQYLSRNFSVGLNSNAFVKLSMQESNVINPSENKPTGLQQTNHKLKQRITGALCFFT